VTGESLDSARAELLEAVRGWHKTAGLPSLRKIAGPAGCSHTTVHELLRGDRIPAWPQFAAIVACLHGDLDQARELWHKARPVPRAHRSAVPDAEAEAIRITSSVLARVTPEGQRRVIAYLQDRFAGKEPE
jgi:hypothetical protein